MQPDFQLQPEHILEFELQHGKITPGKIVFIFTGWSQFWNEPKKYHNQQIFPSVSLDAAKLLLERKIIALGIDTLSPDLLQNDFPVHRLLLGAEKLLIENVANLENMPNSGAFCCVAPLKIQDGTEAPARIFGFVTSKNS